MTENEKTLAEQKAHHADKDVTLDNTPDVDEDDEQLEAADDKCGATTNYDGRVRTCTKEPEHDGKHKAGRYSWRRRSGDRH